MHGLQTSHTIRTFNCLRFNVVFEIFERIFYDLFCEGPSCLRKYASTAVRRLRLLLLVGTNVSVLVVCCIWQVLILAFLK